MTAQHLSFYLVNSCFISKTKVFSSWVNPFLMTNKKFDSNTNEMHQIKSQSSLWSSQQVALLKDKILYNTGIYAKIPWEEVMTIIIQTDLVQCWQWLGWRPSTRWSHRCWWRWRGRFLSPDHIPSVAARPAGRQSDPPQTTVNYICT